MAKKQSGSSARGKRVVKKDKHIADKDIDFSDIPESTNSELKRAKRVGRPAKDQVKKMIAIRVDPKVLGKLKKMASKEERPYQGLIHEILEKATEKAS